MVILIKSFLYLGWSPFFLLNFKIQIFSVVKLWWHVYTVKIRVSWIFRMQNQPYLEDKRNCFRMPKQPRLRARSKNRGWRLSLGTIKVAKTGELWNYDKYESVLLKNGWDPGEDGLDMTHQNLDCPLNWAELLWFIYTHTRMCWLKWTPRLEFQETFTTFVNSWFSS